MLYGRETDSTHSTQGRYPSMAAPEYHGKPDGVPELGKLVFETDPETR